MECVITVELGTNAVRVFAFDLKGNVLSSAKGSYPTFHIQPDYSEQDPEQIFITMLYVLKNMITETLHPRRYVVQSICFVASMHSVLAIDDQGVPLGNVITWADNRGKKEAQELKESDLGKVLYRATGTPIHPMSPLVKIAWMKNNDKSRFARASKFLSLKSYILQQLTGEFVLDYSLASATGLLNIHTMKWEQTALDFAGIQADQLPSLMSVFDIPGKLRKEYQKSLGLESNTRIMVGSSDGCMATLGAGVWREDKATVTVEDSGAVRVVGKKVLDDDKQRFFNYLLAENYYISGGPTNNGGVIFDWFAKQFGTSSAPFDTEYMMDSLIQEAANVRVGSEGLLFLPYLLGERAPIWNANARGSYFGLNIKHERQHFIRATIEGILYEIYSIGKILQEHRTINSLSINGSFATIPFCAQLLADIFNKPVNMAMNANSASRGAFLLSAIDMGIYSTFEQAAESTTYQETIMPRESNHDTHSRYFQIFERLSVKLTEEFEALAALQHNVE
jgi:gluconokinase